MREEVLAGKYRYHYDDAVFPPSTDSFLLAAFAAPKRGDTVAELGAAAGLTELLLAAREESLRFLHIELDAHAVELAKENFAANALAEKVRFYTGDLRERSILPGNNSADYVIANPPYYPAERGKCSATMATARSETECTFEDITKAARYLLRSGGRFAFVHRAERLAELCCILRDNGFAPKRLRLAQHSPSSAPSLMLIEALSDGKPGLSLAPTLLLHDENGRESAEYKRIYCKEEIL